MMKLYLFNNNNKKYYIIDIFLFALALFAAVAILYNYIFVYNFFFYSAEKINIYFSTTFTSEHFSKEEKYVKYLLYDKSQLWAIINTTAADYKSLHLDELVSKGFSLTPEDKNFFKFTKFSSYTQFVEFLKFKVNVTSKGKKYIEFRNLLTYYVFDYDNNILEIYDFYVFGDQISIVRSDDSDRSFLLNNKESEKVLDIMLRKKNDFDVMIEENKKLKNSNWFVWRSTDAEIKARINIISNKINNF